MAIDPGNEAHDPARWVDEHGDALFRYAILRVRNDDLAADLVQDTFLSALKAREGFRGGSTLRTWLIGILKHKIIDHYRKHKVEVLETDLGGPDQEANLQHAPSLTPAWDEAPSSLVENREFWGVLSSCLAGLPEAQRRAFTLREFDGLSGEEIRKVLDVTPTNLWVILHRARAGLRRCMESNWFDGKGSNG
ncbi:MAG TPA: sigma-70 family RNA polymerase sigma factor [Candidatus Krumholzibacteria bacterium]|nr:sigma-70 family RNA polymerase sigma factor [Candidatus Krumholzibacteria bacterium]